MPFNIKETCQTCGTTLEMGQPCVSCQQKIKNKRKVEQPIAPNVEVLNFKPGDTIIVSAPNITDQGVALLAEYLKNTYNTPIVVMPNNIKIITIRKEDKDEQKG